MDKKEIPEEVLDKKVEEFCKSRGIKVPVKKPAKPKKNKEAVGLENHTPKLSKKQEDEIMFKEKYPKIWELVNRPKKSMTAVDIGMDFIKTKLKMHSKQSLINMMYNSYYTFNLDEKALEFLEDLLNNSEIKDGRYILNANQN